MGPDGIEVCIASSATRGLFYRRCDYDDVTRSSCPCGETCVTVDRMYDGCMPLLYPAREAGMPPDAGLDAAQF